VVVFLVVIGVEFVGYFVVELLGSVVVTLIGCAVVVTGLAVVEPPVQVALAFAVQPAL